MLPLTTLEKTSTSILYEIPPGKPNPNQKCVEGTEKRDRVFQSSLKGASCWYYTFNFLRTRIGRHPCESLLTEREIEKKCSQRRKEQTTYDDAFPVSIAELYSKSDMSTLRRLNLKNAKLFLESQFSSSCDLSENLEGRSSIVPYVKEFIEEKTHKDMHEFLVFKRASKSIELNMKFLKNFNTDVHTMTEHKNWKQLDTQQKAVTLDTYVRDFCADLYKLKKSIWKPSQGIDELLDELKQKGPLMILGDFGTSAYIDPPFKMAQKLSNRNIYAWRPGAERDESIASHTVLLVGARKVQDKAFVYFIDPADPSDPLNKDKQKIYMISFTNLTSNLRSLSGHKELDSDIGYAYHGNFKT